MKYYLGFDIGGTKCVVSVGRTDESGIEILGREEVKTASSPAETLERLFPVAEKFSKEYPVESAGISCGGPLDGKKGILLTPPNLTGWHGFEIVKYIEGRYGVKAFLQNDANACALAEWKYGAGRGTRNMVFLTFGTGLGAGLILNGKLYAGTNDNAGEVGHIRLAENGPVGFGKAGSFEGFCSGGGIAKLAAEMGFENQITAKQLSEEAFRGNMLAKRVFEKSGRMLGKGLSILIDLLNPEKIVLGGVFMRSGELLISAMKEEIEKEALSVSASVCEIVPAELKENIGDYAALSVVGGV